MRKELMVYMVLAVLVGVSAVMLPLQAFKAFEEGQTQAKRSTLSAEAEKALAKPEEKELESGRMLIQGLLDIGAIISIGVAAGLIATLISRRRLV
ncbi:MAG TPA: hypothetical protein ENG07_01735 [Candidatus Bathyarchaeota archaeon]|nr:hypothetical protein [Candidatus Bathyarchaeota archaeon]